MTKITISDTEEMRQEQKCLAAPQLTQFSIDNSADAIFWLNKDGKFIYANKAACKSLGYLPEELLTMSVHDIDPNFTPDSWPSHWEKMRSEVSRTIESLHRAKDGRIFPVEILINHLEFEGMEFHCAFVRDISKRKKTENLLRESEKRLRLTLDATSDGMWDRNLSNGSVFYGSNWATSLGYSNDDLIEHKITWQSLLHPEDKEYAIKAVDSHITGKTPKYSAEFRLKNRDGRWQWVKAKGKVVEWDDQGNPLRFVGTHTDITRRKIAEKALRKSSEKIKMFAYSVAHDLKSPAVSILGLAKRLAEKHQELSSEKFTEYCKHIVQSAEEIVKLVDKVNSYIAAKESQLLIETISLNELIQIIRDEFSEELNLRGIELIDQTNKDSVIKADRVSILRVLRNFVDNALKYGGDQLNKIAIGQKETSTAHIICVHDNGIGLKKDESKGLFGPFMRKKTSMKVCGTGLGLAIAKEIAEQHKGEVWTEHEEKGITFCCSISKNL